MANLYANENFPLKVVEELRRLGHDVLTTQEAGKAGQAVPDEEVLDYATAASRAVTFDPDFPGQAQRIHEAIRPLPELTNQLIRVSRPPR